MCGFKKQKKALTFYSQSLICHCNALVLLSFIILPYKTSAFLGGFLLQGFYEELVFRGFFMISIIRKNTIFVAVMVNSILFGLTHGFNNGFQVLALLNLILFGIFESIYLLKTGNIWGISAIHSMWNFIQGNIYGFNVSGMAQSQSIFIFKISNCEIFSGGTFGLEGSLLTTIVLLSAINMVILYNTALQLQ
ncbi:CPBP family intramembrane glutamic endopeptidase [Agathobacter sp.]|uniref:CPBP family intramembrane glutamic endopeptidase n=1 Tax=Agathobacter sp. TaxID=2021311 RepID=UPI00280B9E98|nr:CPBP family intramembrane glutamic endopeptidase [Agathobacter sp.]